MSKGDGQRKDFDQVAFGENLDDIDLHTDAGKAVVRTENYPGKTRYVYGQQDCREPNNEVFKIPGPKLQL